MLARWRRVGMSKDFTRPPLKKGGAKLQQTCEHTARQLVSKKSQWERATRNLILRRLISAEASTLPPKVQKHWAQRTTKLTKRRPDPRNLMRLKASGPL